MSDKQWGSRDLLDRIRVAYPLPTYVVIEEVANSTGGSASRRADALVMGCWPSRGLHLIGVEIKVYRQDWLKELKDPAKADRIAQYCDRWVICAPDGIVRLEELPEPWGWWAPHGAGLSVRQAPAPLDAKPLTRGLLASMLRNLAENTVSKRDYNSLVRAEVDTEVARQIEQATTDLKRQIVSLTNRVHTFEEASGLKLEGWELGKIGEVVRGIHQVGYSRLTDRIERIAGELSQLSIDATTVATAIHEAQARIQVRQKDEQVPL